MQMIPLPNGAKVALATTFGSPITVSAVSNANPAVATAAAHGLTSNDLVLADTPGWERLDSSVRRVDDEDTGTFKFEGLNSTDTVKFPVGGGVGTVREITAWTQLPKIPTFATEGGDAKTITSSYIDYLRDINFITGENATMLNFQVSYAPDSAAHTALQAASDSGSIQVVRMVLPDGSQLYYPGQLHFNPKPITTKDAEMVNNVMLALHGEFTRYAKAV